MIQYIKNAPFFSILMTIIVCAPIMALCLEGLQQSDIFAFLLTTVLSQVVLNTAVITVLSAFGVLVLGVSCAWLVVHYDFPLRGLMHWVLLMPLAFPPYILAYVYTDFFDAAGAFARVLTEYHLPWLRPDLRSVGGASFILTFCLYPYVYLFAQNGFLAVSSSQMESGRLLGASSLRRFREIALPTARPFIMVGVMLVIMEVIADYGTMDYFGIRVFSTMIYDAWAGYGDITAAARLAVMILTFIILLLWAERTQRKAMRFYALDSAKSTSQKRSAGHGLMTLWCALPITVGFVAPVFLLMAMAVQNVGWDDMARTMPYIFNTLFLCSVVAVSGVVLAYILTASARRVTGRVARAAVQICGLGYALPGVILGLGLLLVSSFFTALNILVTGSVLFLVLGYLIRFLNIPLQSLSAGYEKISPSIDQAGQLMQHTAFDSFWRVKLPLLAPAMMSAGLVMAIEVIKELPLTLVLRPFDLDTLAVHTYNLASDERLYDAALPALCIVTVGCIPVLLLHRFAGRKGEG